MSWISAGAAALFGGGLAVYAGASPPVSLIFGALAGLLADRVAERALRERERRSDKALLAEMREETDRLVDELKGVRARLTAMAERFDAKDQQRNQRLVREMRVIEALVQKLAAGVAKERAAPAEAGAVSAGPLSPPANAKSLPVAGGAPPSHLDGLGDGELLEVIRSALEDNRIDLYLQPIVDLPQRRVRFYEGLSRLRSLDGEVIEPTQYLRVAEPAGLVPIIDNLLLFRCVQIVRRLLRRQTKRGVFCNISLNSLTDREFFPQFLEFVAENKALSSLLIFEFSHETITACGPEGEEHLDQLAALGFTFSLDNVRGLKLDFGWLRRRGFRYVKVPVAHLMADDGETPPEIAIANFMVLLGRQGIELIAEKIEDEAAVLALLEHEVRFAQGFLFGRPRPIRRDFAEDDGEPRAA